LDERTDTFESDAFYPPALDADDTANDSHRQTVNQTIAIVTPQRTGTVGDDVDDTVGDTDDDIVDDNAMQNVTATRATPKPLARTNSQLIQTNRQETETDI